MSLDKTKEDKTNLRRIIDYDPDNWIARNELAWLLFKDENFSEAAVHAQRAHELARDNPAVMDTLAVVWLAQGKTEDALALLTRASDRLPDNGEIGFHLAQAQASNGQTEHARKTLRQILTDDQPFDGREQAEVLLKELGG